MLDARPSTRLPSGATVTYQQQYRRCARRRTCRTCSQGKGHGPYWYAFWRQGGRVRSLYIGKERPLEPAGIAALAPQMPVGTAVAIGTLRVTSLGSFAVWQGTRLIPTSVWTKRPVVAALFQSLLCTPGHQLSREAVIESIWHPQSEDSCAGRLDYTIHALNGLLGRTLSGAYVKSRGKRVILAPAGQGAMPIEWLDACAFEQTARAACQGIDVAHYRLARAQYTGAFLPEVSAADSEPDRWDYTHYIIERRRALQVLYTDLLLRLAGLTTIPLEAVNCLQEILLNDPCDERAAAALMRHYTKDGNLTHAKAVYRRLERALSVAQDEAPCAEIRQLRRQLDNSAAPQRPLTS